MFRKVLPCEKPVLWSHRFTFIQATSATVKHLLKCAKPCANGTLPVTDTVRRVDLSSASNVLLYVTCTFKFTSFAIFDTVTCDLMPCLQIDK